MNRVGLADVEGGAIFRAVSGPVDAGIDAIRDTVSVGIHIRAAGALVNAVVHTIAITVGVLIGLAATTRAGFGLGGVQGASVVAVGGAVLVAVRIRYSGALVFTVVHAILITVADFADAVSAQIDPLSGELGG